MRVGIVLVHYQTPQLARDAVDALHRSEGLADAVLDLVVVDNGSDAAGRELLASAAARVLTPGDNLGYAGGVNLGFTDLLEHRPDVLVAMNPDVMVLPRCLAELVRALGQGAGVVGPRFVWGEPGASAGEVLLPPAELPGRRWQMARYLAESRGEDWAAKARAMSRRHAHRHWTATSDLDSHALSGALLAITAEAWDRVGPFDDGYRLYFEETDWLRRARESGVAGRHVPSAVAAHGYARSTSSEPRAAAWFAASERRFRQRWYGSRFCGFLEGMARRHPPRADAVPDGAEGSPRFGPDVRWIEISASPLGLPAGGIHLPEGGEPTRYLPDLVRQRAAETTLYWRTIDAAGQESTSAAIDLAV